MTNASKIALLVALGCVVLGVGLVAVAALTLGLSFGEKDEERSDVQIIPVEGPFTQLEVQSADWDVRVEYSPEGKCEVQSAEKKEEISGKVTVENGVLKVRQVDERKWYEYLFSFGRKRDRLTIVLPDEGYDRISLVTASGDLWLAPELTFREVTATTASGDVQLFCGVTEHLSVTTASGDQSIIGVNAREMTLHAASGDVELEECFPGSLRVETVSGEVELDTAEISGEAYLKTVSGDLQVQTATCGTLRIYTTSGTVELSAADADSLEIRTVSGGVKGTLRSGKRFEVSTTSGSVHVPADTPDGGLCKINTTSGNVRLQIEN